MTLTELYQKLDWQVPESVQRLADDDDDARRKHLANRTRERRLRCLYTVIIGPTGQDLADYKRGTGQTVNEATFITMCLQELDKVDGVLEQLMEMLPSHAQIWKRLLKKKKIAESN